jgi:hypothetical protein
MVSFSERQARVPIDGLNCGKVMVVDDVLVGGKLA